MILHIFNDEKIVSRVISYFSEVSIEANKYVVLVPHKDYKLKYVVPSNDIHCLVYGTKSFWSTIGDVNQYSEIILHYLDLTKAIFVNKIQHHSITWIEWGADLYNQLLAPRGFNLYDEPDFLEKAGLLSWRSKLLRIIGIKGNPFNQLKLQKAVKKISFFVGLYFELDLLKKYYPEFSHLKRKFFFYYPIDDLIDNSFLTNNSTFTGDIMVGNSASPTGNHLSILKSLSKIELKNRKVLIPLSYGDNLLKKHIISNAIDLIPKNVVILEDFMPLKEYNTILSECSNFIYGNLRQEAFGNILVALYLGKKVFLQKKNPLFSFLKKKGIITFELEEIQKEMDSALEQEKITNNRRLILEEYNKERLFSLIKTQYGEDGKIQFNGGAS